MKRAAGHGAAVVVGMLITCAAASASEIGQQVANRIDAATCRYYLDGKLYTHDGDNRGTYPLGPEHDLARDNIVATFQSFGLSVELQGVDPGGQYYNVVATQLGSLYPDSYYVIGAHYDSVGNPGADDDASGVAGLLEMARVLSLYATEYTIKYIAFDQEEMGLVGSSAYVEEHLADDIRGMIQLDMIAHANDAYICLIYGRPQSDPLKLALADAIDLYGNGLTAWVYGQHDSSDHAPFEWAGFQACEFTEAFHADNPCYHYACDSVDTPDYISYNFAADFVRSTAGFLADQAGAQPLFDCDSGAGCEPGTVGDEDCNGNGVWDVCDVICAGTADCNGNLVPDECDLAGGMSSDCNQNGLPDECDVAGGTSEDFNNNQIPDECEPPHTIYVDDDAPGDPGPGMPELSDPLEDGSLEHPFDAIQEAIRASMSRDLILVRPGLYSGEGNRDLDFRGRLITLQSENGPQSCIIDCEGWGRGFYFHMGETSAAVVAGLTIRNGATQAGTEPYSGGGGIRCNGASPTITGCTIVGNYAGEAGGGVLCCNGANPTIVDCVITANDASVGGGVFGVEASPTISGCTIAGNTGGVACWSSGAIIRNCLVVGNWLGVWCEFSDNATIANCTIAGNTAQWYEGGGIHCGDANPTITNCILWDNAPAEIEVASGNPAVTFCDIGGGWPGVGNLDADPLFAGGPSGIWTADGAYDAVTSQITLTDSTAAWLEDALVGKVVNPDTSQSLQFAVVANTATTITILSDWPWITSGMSYQIYDYHLLSDSPCIDAGDPSFGVEPGETDMDGQPRVQNCRVDIGADETPYFLDCNGNGTGDACDIANGTSPDCTGNGIPDECEPDCNGNGVADNCDIAAGTSQDCNANGVPDECEPGYDLDCNANGVADFCDVYTGTSQDCNGNGIPDECDIAAGTSQDANGDGIPDECGLRTIFVNGSTGDDNWNGKCAQWNGGMCGPKKTIQAGIDAATPGDTVLIADGTYTGAGNKNLDLGGKAITVRSAGGAEACVIDCESSGRGLYFHSGETAASLVQGLTIRNGSGVCCDFQSSPILTNCTISGNFGDYGGGLSCCNYSSPTLTHCTIADNTAGGYAGGVYCYVYSCPTLTNCVISGNRAAFDGGGVCCFGHSSPTLTNCTIAGNTTHWGDGGGVYCYEYSNATLTNCTISGNTVSDGGGGVCCSYHASPTLTNCILWGDEPQEINVGGGANPVVTYCDIQGGWPGEGNLDADPLFVEPEAGDYHLTPGSPCVDRGDPAFEPLPDETDIDDEPRVQHCRVDMGADESPYFVDCNSNEVGDACDITDGTSTDVNHSLVPDECESVGDLNCDGTLDLADINPFVLYLSNHAGWLATFPGCDPLNGDINGDGTYGQESLADINPFVDLITHL